MKRFVVAIILLLTNSFLWRLQIPPLQPADRRRCSTTG